MTMLRRSLLCLWLLPTVTGTVFAAAPGIDVFADNIRMAAPPAKISVRHDVSALRFEISAGNQRCRFKFEGLDDSWLPEMGEMNFMVRFLDGNGDQISQKLFPVRGRSTGFWNDWKDSPFVPRSERLTVPDGAEKFSIIISSSGLPTAIGIYAVTSLNVRSLPEDGVPPRILISNARPTDGGNGPLWSKSGTHPSMASSTGLDDSEADPVLIIRDDDIAAHADWEMFLNRLPKVRPGEIIEFDWKEAYTIGAGGKRMEVYRHVPAGNYRLVAETMDLRGNPTGDVSVVEIRVPRPYWKSFWFWALVAGIVAIWTYVLGKRAIRRKINRDIRHAQLISDERLRIARDLHDDLGTRLSHIFLLGSHAGASVSGDEAKSNFKQITQMSGELIAALSESVWLLNSKNNDLESLVNFLCRILGEVCKAAGIRCRIDALTVGEATPVSHEFRHNFSLAVKETINNAIKHSGATEIFMRVRREGSALEISVADNGTGMAGKDVEAGNGLESIAQRMAALKGNAAFQELPDGGLEVTMKAPVS